MPQASIGAALHRMANYVRLAALTVEAELPSYETSQAFGVLSFEGKSLWHKDDRYSYVHKLAKAFDLNAQLLHDQVAGFHPVAASIAEKKGLSTREAWLGCIRAH